MKDKIKMCIAIIILSIIIAVVFMIVIKYQLEGEKNMPYQLSKITIISTAECEQNTTNVDETSKWNLDIYQNNDIYFFIDKNEKAPKDSVINSLTIDNIQITKKPVKGNIETFMPNSLEGRTFTYNKDYIVENKLEYKGGLTSNPKTLEIGNQGGSAIIRFSNAGIGQFVSNEDDEIKHDGTLLTKIGVLEEDVNFQVNFDLILDISNIKYKSNITLDLPCEDLSITGRSSKEILNIQNFVFKRTK